MPTGPTYGFWSYAHEDNELDNDRILELAGHIKEEYNLLSGEPLELFIDRDAIAWGQEWRKRIDSSLAQTTFLISIITPRYFRRDECRRELLEFAAKAKGLGVEELVLPILYIEMPGLSVENPDQAIAIVAKTQYVDWRNTRLLDTRSSEYRTAVNVLARRLLEIANSVVEHQISRELEPSIDYSAGIAEITEQVTSLLPDWLDSVEGDKFTTAQWDATSREYKHHLSRLLKSHSPASARLAVQMRFGREMLPLAERFYRDAQIYAARSTELDPLISSLVRLVSEYPAGCSLVTPIRQAIDEAMSSIKLADERDALGWRNFVDTFHEMRHIGRIFQKCEAITREAHRLVAEANSIVRRWDTELMPALAGGGH